ncbi:uncharacterized protein LOC122659403 [Telopea speciosissima]|uniref:uncharacterized protein LOC122659403 n=1 Tax=Telopea speciosissima TaxID=54955 RepID=UPI001CC783D4|nr:uncharacterized protein LOC122659403 [Telopea speciosissima]
MFVDGSSNTEVRGAGFILTSPEGFKIQFALWLSFLASDKEAEYEALIAGLRTARAIQVKRLTVRADSQLIVNQVNGDYEAKDNRMAAYLKEAKKLVGSFGTFQICRVPRSENEKADTLSRLSKEELAQLYVSVYIEQLDAPAHLVREVAQAEIEPSWMDPIIAYLRDDVLPKHKVKAHKVHDRAARYTLIENELYKRSVLGPLLKCLTPTHALNALVEVHQVICGSHMGGRHLAYKILRAGLYWPNMQKEAIQYVRRCEPCQKFADVPQQPATELTSILSPIPFAMCGMDILGNFTPASGGRKYLVVAVDYFTKWVEAEPLAKITRQQMEKFFRDRIIYRFGLPKIMVTNNGKQFDNP